MSAVQEKDKEGDTAMDFAILNHELLGVILEHLPVDDRFEALKKLDKQGQYTFLHRVVANPESLKMMLKFLPAKTLLDALNVKSTHGITVMNYATQCPESLEIILKCLPAQDLLDILKFKSLNGKTVLNEAAKNPRSLDLILKALSSENLTALIHDEASLMQEGYEKKYPQSEHSQKLVDIICVELNKRKAAMIRATLQENKQRSLCDHDKTISSSNVSSKRTSS